jgi:hypothetical protein
MLAALGAYTARVENKGERYGGKKHCTIVELIQLGFQLIPWNSLYAPSPLPTLLLFTTIPATLDPSSTARVVYSLFWPASPGTKTTAPRCPALMHSQERRG